MQPEYLSTYFQELFFPKKFLAYENYELKTYCKCNLNCYIHTSWSRSHYPNDVLCHKSSSPLELFLFFVLLSREVSKDADSLWHCSFACQHWQHRRCSTWRLAVRWQSNSIFRPWWESLRICERGVTYEPPGHFMPLNTKLQAWPSFFSLF